MKLLSKVSFLFFLTQLISQFWFNLTHGSEWWIEYIFIEIIDQKGASVDSFYAGLKEKQDGNQSFITMLLSISDYDTFIAMMNAYKDEHPPPEWGSISLKLMLRW